MKIGDLVRLTGGAAPVDDGDMGIIIKIISQPQEDLDDLFPYLVHFDNGDADFFGDRHLEIISESR